MKPASKVHLITMSDPYRYTPSAKCQYTGHHQTPDYYCNPYPFTPFFLPTPGPSLRSSSGRGTPYSASSLPPVTPTTSHIPSPSSGYDPYVNYKPWSNQPHIFSWYGPLSSADLAYSGGGISHKQLRHSFGPIAHRPSPASPRLRPVPLPASAHFQSTQLFINPFIHAANPRRDFFFDLAPTAFAPMCLFGLSQSRYLSFREQRELAVYPPVTRLRIICELTEQWPIDIEPHQWGTPPYSPYSPHGFAAQQKPPISLLNVLLAIHQAMHQQVTPADWAKLSANKVGGITRAYRMRCGMNEHEKAKGVKRVDYLLGKTRMMGLLRSRIEDDWEVMELILVDWH